MHLYIGSSQISFTVEGEGVHLHFFIKYFVGLRKRGRRLMFFSYTYNLCTASVVQEAGGCLTKKNASQCKAVAPQGEAVFC